MNKKESKSVFQGKERKQRKDRSKLAIIGNDHFTRSRQLGEIQEVLNSLQSKWYILFLGWQCYCRMGGSKGCSCTLIPLVLLLNLGARRVSESLLPCSSHGLWLCRAPGLAADSGSTAQFLFPVSAPFPSHPPQVSPCWLGAATGRKNLQLLFPVDGGTEGALEPILTCFCPTVQGRPGSLRTAAAACRSLFPVPVGEEGEVGSRG